MANHLYYGDNLHVLRQHIRDDKPTGSIYLHRLQVILQLTVDVIGGLYEHNSRSLWCVVDQVCR